MQTQQNMHGQIQTQVKASKDDSLRHLNALYCIQNSCVLLHILDFETGYSEKYIPLSDVSVPLENIYKNNYMLFAYTALRNNRKTVIYVEEVTFYTIQKLYTDNRISSCLVLNEQKIQTKTINVSAINNNYYAYLYASKKNHIFLIKEERFYRAVSETEFKALYNIRKTRIEKEPMYKQKIKKFKNKGKSANCRKKLLALCIFIAACILSVSFYSIGYNARLTNEKQQATEDKIVNPTIAPYPTLHAKAPPKHGWCFLTNSSAEPNFKIETTFSESNKYYYVKIVDTKTKMQKQAVFIYAGKSVNVYVPYGTYLVRWVSGNNWYGFDNLFGTNKAQQAEGSFTFNNDSGWSITLYPVRDGNLQIEELDIDSF